MNRARALGGCATQVLDACEGVANLLFVSREGQPAGYLDPECTAAELSRMLSVAPGARLVGVVRARSERGGVAVAHASSLSLLACCVTDEQRRGS